MDPDVDYKDVWPGHVNVDRAGAELAVEMLDALESSDTADNGSGLTEADYSQLENWARRGKPFRNIVAEYLQRAREAGPDVDAGFCAVLSDLVSQHCQGTDAEADSYAEMFGIE
jgi:hypothetical protein